MRVHSIDDQRKNDDVSGDAVGRGQAALGPAKNDRPLI